MQDGPERYVYPQTWAGTASGKEAEVADIQIFVAEWSVSREIAMSGSALRVSCPVAHLFSLLLQTLNSFLNTARLHAVLIPPRPLPLLLVRVSLPTVLLAATHLYSIMIATPPATNNVNVAAFATPSPADVNESLASYSRSLHEYTLRLWMESRKKAEQRAQEKAQAEEKKAMERSCK